MHTDDRRGITAEYGVTIGDRTHQVRVTGQKPAILAADDSIEHFFKEHRWGFGQDRRGRLVRYEVTHPVWAIHPVLDWQLDFDWAQVYGNAWGFLQEQVPISVILAAGSPITVSTAL